MAVVLLALLASASAWTWEDGRQHKCPQTKRLEKFDISYRSNTFYHIVRSVQAPFFKGDCVRTQDNVVNGNSVNTDVAIKLFGQTWHYYSTIDYETIPGKYGEYTVTVQDSLVTFKGSIIDTDYKNYFVVYVCNETEDNKSRRDAFGIFALNRNFNPSSLLHLAYEFEFAPEDLEVVNHDPTFCGYNLPPPV